MPPQRLSTSKLPAWQRERAILVHRICKQCAARKERGISISRSIRLFSGIYDGRAFRSDPSRHLHARAKTIERYFFQWRDNGRNAEAVRLKYRSATAPRVTPELLIAFVRICGEPGIRSLLAAFHKLKTEWPAPLPVSYSTLCRYLGRKTLNQLRACHRGVIESQAALVCARERVAEEVLLRLPQSPRIAAA